jgi:hypothetical protein
MFLREAVMKPWQPLGMGMFFPWKSGNWKGALQQWLVMRLYQWTLVAFIMPIFIPLLVFFTWQFWFALTQRTPIGLPAGLCGIAAGVLAIHPITYLLREYTALGLAYHHLGYIGWPKWLDLVGPAIGFLSTSCFVIERRWPVVLLEFSVVMAHLSFVIYIGGCILALLTGAPGAYLSTLWIHNPLPNPLIISLWALCVFVLLATQIYVGICTAAIGSEGLQGNQEEDSQEAIVSCCGLLVMRQSVTQQERSAEKRSVSQESVSTAPTANENPTAGSNHEGEIDEP